MLWLAARPSSHCTVQQSTSGRVVTVSRVTRVVRVERVSACAVCMACVNGGLTWQCHLAGVRSSPDPYPSDMEERQQQEPAPQAPMPMGAQPSPEPSSSGHHGQQLGIPISEQGAAPPPASLSPCQDPSTLSSQCALLNSLSLATATFSDLEAVAALTTTADDQAAAKTLALTSPSDGPALAQGLKAQVQPRLLTSSASAHMMMMVPGAEPFDRGYGRVRGSKSQKEYCMMMARSADCQEVSVAAPAFTYDLLPPCMCTCHAWQHLPYQLCKKHVPHQWSH
ncbi:hypothetical protein HaLaN_02187 [Haematococcus lacustris]|uniref:Uncharacterized protein n=1 Tax=Haematococcus lacustris TaxID=44745 RepID=A0A699YDE3_HAELA|nr:hypothetical protein HaLaN_02187 [Haematococcus lacustris]